MWYLRRALEEHRLHTNYNNDDDNKGYLQLK